MARKISLVCDLCGQVTDRMVGKLYFSPIISGATRMNLSNYTHWADVGECCQDKVLECATFHERVTAKEYNQRRKAGVK